MFLYFPCCEYILRLRGKSAEERGVIPPPVFRTLGDFLCPQGVFFGNGGKYRAKKFGAVAIEVVRIKPSMNVLDWNCDDLTFRREQLPKSLYHTLLIIFWARPKHDRYAPRRTRRILAKMGREHSC